MTLPESAATALPAQRPPEVRVLVVDDAPAFRAAAAAVLERMPGFVLAAELGDGEAALAHPGAVDLVLLDIHLPGIDGISVCEQLVRRPRPPRVVLCSTYAAGDLPARAQSCGALAYLPKDDLRPSVLRAIWAGVTRPAAPQPG